MSENRFTLDLQNKDIFDKDTNTFYCDSESVCELLNEQQTTINKLTDEKEYWKNKAMTLLFQVRRLTSRMTNAEVKEFSKELEDD